jgi:hypothetical protein
VKLTISENEIKDAIIRMMFDKVGKLSIEREDIRLENVGLGETKIIAEIEAELW